jgi:SAM-dependent methyltransferase/glycosyltransferase involved in cell wall biosynthesis
MQSLLAQGEALRRCDSVVLTDDCSQDKTIEVAKAAWSGPIPLIIRAAKENRGEYKNMNECIAQLPAHIEWYLVMHADNFAKPGWIETLLDAADQADSRVGTICTSWDNLAEDGTVWGGDNRYPPTVERIEGNAASVLGTLKKGCWWHISSCVTRVRCYREIGGLPLGLRLKGDWDFLLRLLSSGWDVIYLPIALMRYRMNPMGSSSITFRRHRDIYETLTVLRRHLDVMSSGHINSYHMANLWILIRRMTKSSLLGQWERAMLAIPTSGFVFSSLAKSLMDKWLGRRRFDWVSSTSPESEARLVQLAISMTRFYGQPSTRLSYQAMLDAEASAQPETEAKLRKAVLRTSPNSILEVGCGSGRIFQRLISEGMTAQYIGVEISETIIAENRVRFPHAVWHVGTSDTLPVKKGSQDCVFAYYVLEHCVFPQRVLDTLLDVLTPGGRLVLTFPDIVKSRIFGSQAVGWDVSTAKEHLRSGRVLHAIVRFWDTRVRLPAALRSAHRGIGAFPVNLRPQCLEPGIRIDPDVDAVYIASRTEVANWAVAHGCKVDYPGGQEYEFGSNVLIEITKPKCSCC